MHYKTISPLLLANQIKIGRGVLCWRPWETAQDHRLHMLGSGRISNGNGAGGAHERNADPG